VLPAAPAATFPTAVLDRIAAAARSAGTWCVHAELTFDAPLDAERLRRAAALLLEAEPILGCRLDESGRQPVWVSAPGAPPVYVEADAAGWDAVICTPIDLATGPLVRVAHDPASHRVLLTATHAATDGGGMVHALGRLAELYRALGRDPDHRPTPDPGAPRGLRQLWRALPWRMRLQALSNAGQRLQLQRIAFPAHQLRIPDDGRQTDTLFLSRSLHSAPLAAWARARGATVNDLLQAAMLRALVAVEPWDGTSALSLNSTIDLRRHLPGGRARAVCNLSTGQLLTLGRTLGDTLDDTVAAVGAFTRAQKAAGLGLSLEVVGLPLVALVPYARLRRGIEEALAKPRDGGRPADSLTNVGTMDPAWFAFDAPPAQMRLLPQFLHPSRYQVVGYGFGEATWLVSGVWPSAAREARVGALLDAMVEALGPALEDPP
jgi:NRPS condensation-like uncharacterized protein